MEHPTWWNRWKKYPLSCLGHVIQGAIACLLILTEAPSLMTIGVLWAAFFVAYQGLSFARKVNQEGRGDTAGLDSTDFLVGLLVTTAFYIIWRLI